MLQIYGLTLNNTSLPFMHSISTLSSKLDKISKNKLNAQRQKTQNSKGNPDEIYRDFLQSASDNQNV